MKKYLWLALVLVAGGLILYVVTGPGAADENKDAKVVTAADGLKYQDLKVGDGETAKEGDVVQVYYTGWLTADGVTMGKQFDSNADGGKPFPVKLGAGEVIKGWDEGLVGMKVGGKRRLIIPPSLGYGDEDHGPIPGKSTLMFDVELLKIK